MYPVPRPFPPRSWSCGCLFAAYGPVCSNHNSKIAGRGIPITVIYVYRLTWNPPANPLGRRRSARVKRRTPLAAAVATAAVTATAAAMIAGPATAQPSDPSTADAAAARSASAFVAGRPPALHASADEAYVQHPVISSGGMRYVPYDRTYKDLPVIGGDFVVAVDAAGHTT